MKKVIILLLTTIFSELSFSQVIPSEVWFCFQFNKGEFFLKDTIDPFIYDTLQFQDSSIPTKENNIIQMQLLIYESGEINYSFSKCEFGEIEGEGILFSQKQKISSIVTNWYPYECKLKEHIISFHCYWINDKNKKLRFLYKAIRKNDHQLILVKEKENSG
jgi:hypothetical protein